MYLTAQRTGMISGILVLMTALVLVFGIMRTASAQSHDPYDSYVNAHMPEQYGNGTSTNYENYGGNGYGGWNYGTSTNANGGTFRATLLGANEVPPVSTTTTTGSTTVSFAPGGASMSFALDVQNGNSITMAHLHCGRPGVNGPIVVTLFSDNPTNVNGPLASGPIQDSSIDTSANCTSVIGYNIMNVSDLANAIQRGDIYANVHDSAHMAGVARGQLPAAPNTGGNNGGYGNGGNENGQDGYGNDHGWNGNDWNSGDNRNDNGSSSSNDWNDNGHGWNWQKDWSDWKNSWGGFWSRHQWW